MRPLFLLTLAVGCGTAPTAPPPPQLARSMDALSEEKKRALVEAERLYRDEDPAFSAALEELARDPETAYWFAQLLVFDLVEVWDRAEASDERMLQSALGQRSPAFERALTTFDAMGTSTLECLTDVVIKSQKFETREVGVRLLARLGEPALPAVGELQRHAEPRTRRLAAEVVANMEEPVPDGYIALLREMAGDTDFTVRSAVVKGLVRGGEEEAELVRELMLEDPDDFVRRTAASEILAFTEPAPPEALVRYLELCIQSGDRRGVEAADASLRRLAGRRESGNLESWKAWLRSVSGTLR
jgi:hypothetical protein